MPPITDGSKKAHVRWVKTDHRPEKNGKLTLHFEKWNPMFSNYCFLIVPDDINVFEISVSVSSPGIVRRWDGKTITVSNVIFDNNTIPRHKGRFWSIQFSLRKRSNKFPNQVSHTKFDLLYFVKEMLNGKEILHASFVVPIQ